MSHFIRLHAFAALLLTTGTLALCSFDAPSVGGNVLTVVVADTTKADPETGLAIDNNLTLVRAHCTGCHSTKLILQNRFTRDGWKQKIRWMQRTQKLWDLGEAEPAVLDYLTKHYGPEDKPFDGRRLPLKGVRWHQSR
ncbi:hypothetical protein FAES_2629 [Fibrella aestuarina BUZ 2]|uniref:Uncharacterized protein n=1 Tax=Fibrella aestuarina BUZ 2 TaxID=1166018 RepID=I0K935_9BACT|nr:hypothetical protein [Fibrella aestuarina]CCH00638.1 hypothetical protein FAES_2629 [Fibrella aestuarina BUZ 2]